MTDDKLREECIRDTVERSQETHQLRFTRAEIDHAVKVGMNVSDGRDSRTWREIADAGIASVKTNRER